jgi:GT2 family glycosyltransferase
MNESPRRFHLRDCLFFALATLQVLIRLRRPTEFLSKAYLLWKRAGIAGVWHRIWYIAHSTLGYTRWVKQFDTLDSSDQRAILSHIDQFCRRPRISVLMPTYNSSDRWLRQAIESVRSQLYPNWELCIADDASPQPHVRAILEEYQRLDERIKIVFRDCNGHISAASNSAFELATGEFVALLDHDDELPQHALYMVALAIEKLPELNMIYSDEDKIDEHGRRFGPYFKPDWNPDLFTSHNMISHLGVYRTEVLRAIGGFREGVEGSQDWDVALRVVEKIPPSTIRHIPHVLYHWRAISGSTAIGHEEKPYVVSASQRVVREHLQRINQSASVEPAFSSFVRICYALPTPLPLVSIILLGDSVNSEELIRHTHYPALEIFQCSPNDDSSLAEMVNRAAKQARGELLCLLDAGLQPETEVWLEELVGHAWRPEIGAVGPMQLDADGNIQGALTVLCNTRKNSVSWSFYQGMHYQETGMAGRAALQQNVTVFAPGCLILRTETFWMLNGLDTQRFPNTLFEHDLCLRLVQAGYRNLWTPYARVKFRGALKTYFNASDQNEVEEFRIQWQDFLDNDPAHNPNLACGGEWPFPAFPPRIDRHWG